RLVQRPRPHRARRRRRDGGRGRRRLPRVLSARVLITGAGGFAGSHLAEACVAAGDEVIAASRSAGERETAGARAVEMDLLDAAGTAAAVAETEPVVVYHLAALASVPASWGQPGAPLSENLMGSLDLL